MYWDSDEGHAELESYANGQWQNCQLGDNDVAVGCIHPGFGADIIAIEGDVEEDFEHAISAGSVSFMEPSNGFSSSGQDSAVSRARRMSWDRPAPLPHDAIQHESLTWDHEEPIPRTRQHPDGQPHDRPFRHEVHSQASDLDSPIYQAGELDDTVHLTSQNTVWRRSAPYERDLELRRRGDRNRGDQRAGDALKAVGKSIRRASVRVVNFQAKNMDDRPVKLDDVDEYPDTTLNAVQEQPGPHLRGKTLGIFGPKNPIRVFMHKMLSSPFTEATILLLIIINAVILTIQSVRQVFQQIQPGPGYFHSWEDLVLLGLFGAYTIEALSTSNGKAPLPPNSLASNPVSPTVLGASVLRRRHRAMDSPEWTRRKPTRTSAATPDSRQLLASVNQLPAAG
ncbi:16593_t:CDS:2 [Acaulospora colombiana]|uniref:16593_t:CDS:1 n=1 Tax=Acaulospora colombiana TaxID=27376 RepID=A0ACA9P3E1_9GLOM|nr:16593_t:CDS:2 [Acaulospora colombiana]